MTTLPPSIVKVLASLEWRLGHLLWHGIRDEWNSMSPLERAVFLRKFPEWCPPRPSLNKGKTATVGNGAGRDFLLMHRHMVHQINCMLECLKLPKLDGWKAPPPSNDRVYRVVHDPRLPAALYPARDDRVWDWYVSRYNDLMKPESLKNISLDHLGTEIEYGIHAAMHVRFGVFPTNGVGLRYPMWPARDPTPDSGWLDPGYDTLLDPWSAHVHPWFWKIHVFVDACIDEWQRWHEPDKGPPPWMGGMHHDHSHPQGTEDLQMTAMLLDQWSALRHEMPRLELGGFFQTRKLPSRAP